MEILKVNEVKKTYTSRFGGNRVQALKGVTFSVQEGEYVAIMGESGSGKTTLLNILAALDRPTAGEVLLSGKNLETIPEGDLAAFRRDNLGFVFQEFNLLDTFSIEDILHKFPYEISGGQKQRAAVARAMIAGPKLLLADEPTGALDSASSADLLRMFEKVNGQGQTILMVTHSVDAASHAGRVLFIRDGVVFHQIYRGECSDQQLYKKISDTLTMLRTGSDAE